MQDRFDPAKDEANVAKHGDGRLFTAVFTWRGDLPRFVSVRRSNKGEERAYRSTG
jgi:uncharacterized DUF497 family protein